MNSSTLTAKESLPSDSLLLNAAALFPVLLFVLVRQFYSNLLGVNRDLLTVLLLGIFSVLGLVGFLRRFQEEGNSFLLMDTVTVLQAFLGGLGILAYSVFLRIDTAEAVSSLYYYCLAPFLVYAG